ncbi:hypothetical protein ACFPJ1_25840 [Kribbella qitaiheensis]|uniref:hypothetical protein n=1 Tax=Kribbella qitaiheensis TaxID=1544730 RepID=UPI0036167545
MKVTSAFTTSIGPASKTKSMQCGVEAFESAESVLPGRAQGVVQYGLQVSWWLRHLAILLHLWGASSWVKVGGGEILCGGGGGS